MDIQRSIGADIIMAFDECPPYPSDHFYARTSMELTHRWLGQMFTRFNEAGSKIRTYTKSFSDSAGGTFADLRKQSCDYISSKNAAGNAIGGLSVGEPEEMMYEFTDLCCDNLPV